MSTEYYRTVLPSLPGELAIQLEQLCHVPSTEPLLDVVIRFICGAGCPETFSDTIRSQWSKKQQEMRKALYALCPSSLGLKRAREGDTDIVSGNKRQKFTPTNSDVCLDERSTLEDVGQPVFTLRSISVTSPIRKKVDITIHKTSIRFTSPGTHSIEATVPLSALHRAFLLPTRGKHKAHWTIVLISSDNPDRGKPNRSSAQAFPQVIFGVDATTTSSLATTKYNSKSEPTNETVPKGGTTLPSLKIFLSYLDTQILEPTTKVFTSACSGYGANAGQNGIPGVEAYRAAKAGSLWFMKEGILWGESKPCEFWAVEDLLGKGEGLRLLTNPGGRTCSVTLTRRGGDEVSPDDEDVGIESELTMIDSREQEGITQWVRSHRHLFGRKGPGKEENQKARSPAKAYAGAMTIHQFGGASDDEDEDFEMESEDEDSGSGSSSESDEEYDKGEESGAQDSDAEGSDEEVEELKEEHHPLLQRGAVPRMSKATIEMIVSMVEEDFRGGKGAASSDEEDELED
ncbi:hypothetical protein APHAL10511_003870 [Amanita phalloides]|nr:hypothetical protein APHAL10511_003870 [Amanita phalloides]